MNRRSFLSSIVAGAASVAIGLRMARGLEAPEPEWIGVDYGQIELTSGYKYIVELFHKDLRAFKTLDVDVHFEHGPIWLNLEQDGYVVVRVTPVKCL